MVRAGLAQAGLDDFLVSKDGHMGRPKGLSSHGDPGGVVIDVLGARWKVGVRVWVGARSSHSGLVEVVDGGR